MAKSSKKNTREEIKKSKSEEIIRDDVHVQRNFMEQTLLNIKHYAQHNRTVVLRSMLALLLFIVVTLVAWGTFSFYETKANTLLYQGQKIVQEIEQRTNLLAMLKDSSPSTPPSLNEKKIPKKNQKENDKQGSNNAFKKQIVDEIAKESKKAEQIFLDIVHSWKYITASAQELAKYELGKLYLMQDKYDQAVNFFEMFIDDNSGHFFASNAYLLLGQAWEKQKKYQKALDVYKRLWQVNAKSYAIPNTLYNMARMQERLGKKKDAQNTYQRIIKEFNNKSFYFVDKARKRLYLLGMSD